LGYSESLKFFGVPNATSCTDMKQYCDEDTESGAAARGICPETCGCKSPTSSLVLSAAAAGCPSSCEASFEYQEQLKNAPCKDKTLEELRSSSSFWSYRATHMVEIVENAPWPDFIHPMMTHGRDVMLEHGCAAVEMLYQIKGINGMNLCDETVQRGFPFKSVRMFCPEACNCTAVSPNCPNTCPLPVDIPGLASGR